METTLVIIRGNSGSGKTTLAQALQRRVGHHTLLVSQDVVRRDMLMSHDSIGLIEQIACYGLGRVPVVIVEGILARDRYGKMLARLSQSFPRVLTYYFEVSFATTLARHQKRHRDFGVEDMRRWWLPHDTLGVANEVLIGEQQDLTTEVQQIMTTIHDCD